MLNNLFYLSKNPLGKVNNIIFGICCLLDGFTHIVSFGFIASSFTLLQSHYATKRYFKKKVNASI